MSIHYLSSINSHPRDANISFQEEGHIYTVNGERDYTSVTTFIHSLFENFDPDKIITNMMSSKNWKNSKYYGKTREEIKAGWDANRDLASSAGTKLHYDIECKYNGMNVENTSIEYEYFMNFYKDYIHLTPYRTEMLVYFEELKLSGSIDMLFKCEDGTFEIYDWKRCKEIVKHSAFNKWMKNPIVDHLPDTNYWHYSLQLNIYKAILIKKYNMQVGKLYLVALHPDNVNYIRIPVVDLQNEVEMLFNERLNNLNIN